MQHLFLYILAIGAGVALAVQAGLNSELGRVLRSPIYATLVSFITGGVALAIYCVLTGVPFENYRRGFSLPWYYWLGGVLGGLYVYAIIFLAPRLGVAVTIGLTVASQMLFSLVIDQYGWMGIPQQSITWTRALGALLIIGGVILLRDN